MFENKLKRNIPLDYLFIFSSNLNFTHGIWMIFLAAKGFTLFQLGIMESVFHITSFLMEVPTGIVADIWGRKISRLWGRIFFFLSLGIMFFASSFWIQLFGFILTALGYNLESGAGEALIYDSLVLGGEKDRFMKVKGVQEFLFQLSFIFSFLAGGYLAVTSYGTVFGITGVTVIISLIVALFFREARVSKNEPGEESERGGDAQTRGGAKGFLFLAGRSIKEQVLGSMKVLKERPRIGLLILFSEIIFVFYTTEFFYLQNFWKGEGLNEWGIGIIYAIQCGVSGITGLLAPKIEKKIGEKGILMAGPVFLALGMWGIALTPYSAAFFVASGILEGILVVAISDYVNKLIPSEYRATILSLQSMCFSMGMIFLFPLFGFISDTVSMKVSFLATAVLATLGGGIFIFRIFLKNPGSGNASESKGKV
ncbi:MAG: MFS transporter [Spirochaetales bacterium]|nr:MFS transporter [Spirochaetales bacterium]